MHLFELPKVEPRYIPKKRNVAMPDLSTLKSQQKEVFEGLKDYVLDKEAVGSALLAAPAGCGKTYVVSKLIEYVLSDSQAKGNKGYKIACTATTNKAVKVTYRQADYYHSNIDYKTVHSLLGLREQITSDGKQIFVQDKQNPPELDEYDILFIDEVSMLSSDLLLGNNNIKGIQAYIEDGLKVIFTGDMAQIPPINSGDSPVFDADTRELYNVRFFVMDEVVRQAADNPIIGIATECRKKLWIEKNFGGRKNMLWDGNKGVYFIDKSDDNGMDDLQELIEHVFTSENFKADPDFAKVIAYHRKVVTGMNRIIRELLFGEEAEESRILVGEKLLVNTPVFEQGDNGMQIMLPTNEEIDVVSFTDKIESVNDGQYLIPYHDTVISYYRMDNSPMQKRIKIPTTEGQQVVDEILEQFAAVATMHKKGGNSLLAARTWAQYFQFKREFADVGYNYAITAHRSQGSTYQNAIVLEYDIDKNRKVKERQRIKYTAFTRPSQRLFIVN